MLICLLTKLLIMTHVKTYHTISVYTIFFPKMNPQVQNMYDIYKQFPGNSVGIGTGYGLDGPGIESVEARFSAPVQTGPGAHPASCTMGTGPFPGVESGRGVTMTPHPF
jgi:hypothetical protein